MTDHRSENEDANDVMQNQTNSAIARGTNARYSRYTMLLIIVIVGMCMVGSLLYLALGSTSNLLGPSVDQAATSMPATTKTPTATMTPTATITPTATMTPAIRPAP